MAVKTYVLVGFGYCSKKNYMPVLYPLAKSREIELFVLDNIRIPKIDPGVTYLNINTDRSRIADLHPNVVFIVTPDETHCELAKQWLGRADIIYIEKPFDASLEVAASFVADLSLCPNTEVRVTDHYLSKFPSEYILRNREELFAGIGSIIKIKTALLEPQEIEPGRAVFSLMADMIPHTIVCANLFFNAIDDVEINTVHVAQYEDSPIKKETFTFVSSTSGNLELEMFIGKCVEDVPSKFAHFKGTKGDLVLNYVTSQVLCLPNDGIPRFIGEPQEESSYAYVGFLKSVLSGGKEGSVSCKEALSILKMIANMEKRVPETLPVYPKGASLDEIMEIARGSQ